MSDAEKYESDKTLVECIRVVTKQQLDIQRGMKNPELFVLFGSMKRLFFELMDRRQQERSTKEKEADREG